MAFSSSGLGRRTHGRLATGPGGYRAYFPHPLPPTINWDEALIRHLSAAERSIGRLDGEGRHLSNPKLSVSPFTRKEAVFSSRIERTQTTLKELLATEAGSVVDRSPPTYTKMATILFDGTPDLYQDVGWKFPIQV